MTDERTIEILEIVKSQTSYFGAAKGMIEKAVDSALKALSEIQQYRSIGTVEECRAAVDKQRGKQITHEATLRSSCTCPSCKNVVDKFETWGDSMIRVKYKYCHFCGQKLNWSDTP